MYLSQEVTSKDQQLKTQMAVSFQDDKTKNSEKVWQESEFFDERRSDLAIPKANLPENTWLRLTCQVWWSSKMFRICSVWAIDAGR